MVIFLLHTKSTGAQQLVFPMGPPTSMCCTQGRLRNRGTQQIGSKSLGFDSNLPSISLHPRVRLAAGLPGALPNTHPSPSMKTQSVPGLVPFFHESQAVAVHIWSLDSEALPAGPTARDGPCCPLFAQLKLVNWNWSGFCGAGWPGSPDQRCRGLWNIWPGQDGH